MTQNIHGDLGYVPQDGKAFLTQGALFTLHSWGSRVRIQIPGVGVKQGWVGIVETRNHPPAFVLRTCRGCFYDIGKGCTYEGGAIRKTRIDSPGYLQKGGV